MNLRYERSRPQNINFSYLTKIIWHPDEVKTYYDRPKNSLCLFRKSFSVEKNIKKAQMDIFADSRYIVYIIEGIKENGDTETINVKNNHQRFVVHNVDWNVKKIILIPVSTYGCSEFRVFGIELF